MIEFFDKDEEDNPQIDDIITSSASVQRIGAALIWECIILGLLIILLPISLRIYPILFIYILLLFPHVLGFFGIVGIVISLISFSKRALFFTVTNLGLSLCTHYILDLLCKSFTDGIR